ncbi:hypothetical protein F4054_04095 [Candidatus Poribacteria bacterium]|nr:hypothetical protein [Candidatus Poribacteria bacterium]MYG08392.1 hypothetical protein [Candidatus Poribacteria bacterium]MYK21424.1 hypothetical protein [Candidatus Poribacteria bacterium]
MKFLPSVFFALRFVVFFFFGCALLVLMSCAEYESWTNDPPEIQTFTLPKEVRYGESVRLKVGAFDPENDELTYTWEVSAGTLASEQGAEIQWTAPEIPTSEIEPDETVRVHVLIRDGGEKVASKSAAIIVYSKTYRIAEALSGSYELVRTQIAGETTEAFGSMRLTTATFTREYERNNTFTERKWLTVSILHDQKHRRCQRFLGNLLWTLRICRNYSTKQEKC